MMFAKKEKDGSLPYIEEGGVGGPGEGRRSYSWKLGSHIIYPVPIPISLF